MLLTTINIKQNIKQMQMNLMFVLLTSPVNTAAIVHLLNLKSVQCGIYTV